jgi:hypothetical protein
VVRRREPEKERKQARLDPERGQEQHRQRGVESRRSPLGPGAGQIGKVEGARLPVEQADGGEQERRRQQIQRDVNERRMQLCTRAMERHQHER